MEVRFEQPSQPMYNQLALLTLWHFLGFWWGRQSCREALEAVTPVREVVSSQAPGPGQLLNAKQLCSRLYSLRPGFFCLA